MPNAALDDGEAKLQEECSMTHVVDQACAMQQAPGIWLLYENGQSVLAHAGGERRRLHRTGHFVNALSSDWSVEGIHLQLIPIVIILLRCVNGSVQRWVIDASDEAYDDAIPRLPQAVRDALHLSTMRLLRDMRRCNGTASAAWNAFPRPTRLELLANFASYSGADGRGLLELFCPLDADNPPMLSVSDDDGIISVLLPNRMEIPILFGGSALRTADFQPGWTADALHCDFAPLYLLMLRHDGGGRAVWVLDRNLLLVGDRNNLSQSLKEELRLRVPPVLRRFLESVLEFADPNFDPVVERWLQVDPETRDIFCALCADMIYPEPTSLGLQQTPSVLPVFASNRNRQLALLRHEAIERAVTTDLHAQVIRAIREGGLQWPSPVDGSQATLQGVFIWDDYAFFYQFADQNGLEFLVVTSDRSARVIALLLPTSNLLLFDDSCPNSYEPNMWLRNNLGGSVWEILIRHVNQYAPEMASRRLSMRPRPVNVFLAHPRVHIGHHLWNDLSGLEALCRVMPPECLPTTLIIGAPDGGAELFGPVEVLFPAMLGHVDRSLDTVDMFIRWAYRNGFWPARITREYVSASLRRRVVDHLVNTHEAARTRTLLAARRADQQRAPTIIFGLRVEDRTLVDLAAFCQAFVGFVAERHPGSTIVFDSYNCRPGATSGAVNPGMVYYLAQQPPERIEVELVASLIKQFDGQPVTIVSTIGRSMAESLAWCCNADAAFAIWGAGLAKIRWLANLPAMIVTSRNNILHRSDLAIYHDPKFMEDPTPVIMPAPSWITDAPEHVALASGFIQGNRECFVVNTEKVLAEFGSFLNRIVMRMIVP